MGLGRFHRTPRNSDIGNLNLVAAIDLMAPHLPGNRSSAFFRHGMHQLDFPVRRQRSSVRDSPPRKHSGASAVINLGKPVIRERSTAVQLKSGSPICIEVAVRSNLPAIRNPLTASGRNKPSEETRLPS
jgi:hypothetical protein